MVTSFYIRDAVPADVDTILQLIVDLATYEKEPESAKATPELLRKNLFETPVAHALVAFAGSAEDPGEAIGFALYFLNFSTWTGRPGIYVSAASAAILGMGEPTDLLKLEDLYVKPEYRSLGAGKGFFKRLGEVAQAKGCARMDWVVLKWNQPSIDFYEKRLGAKAMSEWVGMRLDEDGIQNLKDLV